MKIQMIAIAVTTAIVMSIREEKLCLGTWY